METIKGAVVVRDPRGGSEVRRRTTNNGTQGVFIVVCDVSMHL